MKTGTADKPLTLKEANELREQAVKDWRSHPGCENDEPKFTCASYVFLAWCEYAYDCYNTDGDYLAEK